MNKSSLNRFEGADGRRRLLEALRSQPLIRDEGLATEFAKCVRLEEVPAGSTIITQGGSDSDLFLILSGEFSVTIDRHVVAHKRAGEHVGEMAIVDPGARRSASVTATSKSVVARVAEREFSALADKFPRLWRRIALELANRLRDRGVMPLADKENGRPA